MEILRWIIILVIRLEGLGCGAIGDLKIRLVQQADCCPSSRAAIKLLERLCVLNKQARLTQLFDAIYNAAQIQLPAPA